MEQERRSLAALDSVLKAVQVVSVVAGVVASVYTVSVAANKDAEARMAEAARQTLELNKFDYQRKLDALYKAREAALPFLKLRMDRYQEAVKVAGVLADKDRHTPKQYESAERRFWELYWAELSMVETSEVESRMVDLKKALDPQHTTTALQAAVVKLAQEIRRSTARSWGIKALDTPFEP